MPLTEIQLPDKTYFYRDIQSVASELTTRMLRWQELSDFIQKMDVADMDAMGIPTGQVRTDLQEFRIALDEIVSMFNGNSVTPTNSPAEVMDKLRRMLIG